jgi:hypothetical protein
MPAAPSWPPLEPAPSPARTVPAPPASAPKKAATAAKAPTARKPAAAKPAARKAAAPKPAARKPVNGTERAEAAAVTEAWVAPVAGACPAGYPVKATRSGVFHVPGGTFYERTTPERCYATPAAAETDGYRASKR